MTHDSATSGGTPEVGLEGLLSYEQALSRVLAAARELGPVGAEEVSLEEAAGRVLAEDVVAREDVPLASRATMDGYAVRARDVAQASEKSPVVVRVLQTVTAGSQASARVGPLECVRVMTGVPLPPGADAVVPQEVTAPQPGGAIAVMRPVGPGANTFAAGGDIRAGEVALREGRMLTAGAVGLLAALGRVRVRVRRRPVFAVVATGDEVVEASAPRLGPGQVRNSNAYALGAQLRAWGASVRLAGVARDDEGALRDTVLAAMEQADALAITGGMSVGLRDLVHATLAALGVQWRFHRVAIRPGRPVAFGVWDGRPVFGLPGTPGGAMVAAELFMRPLVRVWLGHPWHPPELTGTLATPLEMAPGRMRWLRARAWLSGGRLVVEPLARQSSSSVRSPAEARVLVAIPVEVERLPAGAEVRVRLLADTEWDGLPGAAG
ncbi:MAG: molybdopterin molybdotransferase MoeA [Limnochordaceae bacterium]|nr:molybdopterin molybdotransferase MoeA [Limnochordaceae bacterium]